MFFKNKSLILGVFALLLSLPLAARAPKRLKGQTEHEIIEQTTVIATPEKIKADAEFATVWWTMKAGSVICFFVSQLQLGESGLHERAGRFAPGLFFGADLAVLFKRWIYDRL